MKLRHGGESEAAPPRLTGALIEKPADSINVTGARSNIKTGAD
jgi:hypothetical protein